jgi:hypothetical protein
MFFTNPTIEELRTKASSCFAEAEQYKNPDSKQKLIEIGLEYERLAKASRRIRGAAK